MNTATISPTTFDSFVHYLATGEDPHHCIAENLKGEMNFPGRVFGLLSKAAFDELRARVSDQPWEVRVESMEPTPSGFVTVIEYDATLEGKTDSYRTITAVTVAGERITHLAHWCTGALE
jgi:hypothetical protein